MEEWLSPSQTDPERESLREIWNSRAGMRLSMSLFAVGAIITVFMPTETTSSVLTAVDAIGGVVLFTGLVSIVAIAVDPPKRKNQYVESGVISTMRFETPLLSFGTSSSSPPPAPDGYRRSRENGWPLSTQVFYGLLCGIPLAVGFVEVGLIVTEYRTVPFIMDFGWQLLIITFGAVLVANWIARIVVGLLVGLQVRASLRLPFGVGIRLSGGLLSRREGVVLTLAPVVVAVTGGTLLVFSASPWLATVGTVGLFLTAFASGGSVHRTWLLLKEPADRLWYYPQEPGQPVFVYDSDTRNEEETRAERIERWVSEFSDRLKVDVES